MNNIKILSIAVIAIALIGSGYYLTQEKSQNESVTTAKEESVTIRLLKGSGSLYPWEIVKKVTGRDILNEENVKLEYVTSVPTSGGTVSIQALLANNIDYVYSASWAPWVNAVASGAKIKAVHWRQVIKSKENPVYYWIVLENSSIYTAKDWVGKKIAVNVLGADADYTTRFYLKKSGFSIDQVQLVVVPSAQVEQALRTNQVDIAWVSDRAYRDAKSRGGIREVINSYEIRGKITALSGGGFREDFIKEHPDTVKRYISVFEKSHRIVWDEFQKNPEAVRKAVAEILKENDGKPGEANYYVPEFVPEHPFVTDEDVQWWIDMMIEDGKLKEGQIKPSDVYTNEFNPYYKKQGEIKI